MARLVKHHAHGPYTVNEDDVGRTFCQCGLSQNLPYCDGSHGKTCDEEPGKTYVYDDGSRSEVKK